jgi:hypothetical protein
VLFRSAGDTNVGDRQLALFSTAWAAPEQIRCEPVAPSADVYGLGLLAAYALSGRRVFPATSELELLMLRGTDDVGVERGVAQLGLPEPVANVVRWACRTSIEARCPDPETFVAALRDALDADAHALRDGAVIASGTLPAGTFGESSVSTHASPGGAVTVALPPDPVPRDVGVGSHRVRLVRVSEPTILGERGRELGCDARVRVALMSGPAHETQVHVKGVDCFLRRAGARATGAVDLRHDERIELLTPDRRVLGAVRFVFGTRRGDAQVFDLEGGSLVVPLDRAPSPVLLEVEPRRDRVLIFGARRSSGR